MEPKDEKLKNKKTPKINSAQIAVVKKGIQSAPDNLKAISGIVQAKPGKKAPIVEAKVSKVTVKPTEKPAAKTIGKIASVIKQVAPSSKKMSGELGEVTVKGSPESNLEFGVGTNKKMYPREDIIGASKAGFLSGIDVTSNNSIRQSAGKYNRMIPELELGIQLYKNKLKKQQENK